MSAPALRPFDAQKAAQAITMLLEAVGEDPTREGLLDTPERVARMYEEVLGGMRQDPGTLFKKSFGENHREMVLVKDIPFYSLCEHHLVPFFGVAHIAYLPGKDGRVCGLSKLARLVDAFARRLQVQERLTSQIADTLVEQLAPNGVIVVIEAEHLCMSMRGVKKPGSRTITSAVRGGFERSISTRSEALSLIYG
ncbi:MAG: GTP cyclohydrolase I FolE [Coriobacteriales bacterium]|jgi:GTP cyclohydrolase I|nr:GTP cyclohydrolase I FolE [Coriobacteriales bacterium]